jgi:Baseplate J-like protein
MTTTLIPSAPDYTDKDFESINRRLETLIAGVFPKWTDFNRANFGNILKESFAFCFDILAFYQDQQARETRWATATQRASIIALAKLIGYELQGASAATADMTLALAAALPGDLTLTAETIFKTGEQTDPTRFQALSDITFLAGNTSPTGVPSVENSAPQDDTYTATGDAGEEFVLSQSPYLDGSLVLVIGVDTWTEQETLLDSTASDKHFLLTVDQNDQATVKVGDGVNGAIPATGATVTAAYKTGGGSDGNVEADTIIKVEGGPFYDVLGNRATFATITNPSAAAGGSDRETVEQARVRAPRSLRVLNRAVARTDFEDLALQVAGTARALMLTKIEDSVVEEGRGWLYLIPEGASGAVPSGALKTTVKSYIDNEFPPPLTFDWEIKDPDYLAINVVATVYLTPDTSEAATVTAIREALQGYFATLDDDGLPNAEITFGYYYRDSVDDPDPKVPLSEIANLINDSAGVRRLGTPGDGEGVTLNGSQDDADLTVRQFPSAGTLTLTNGDTSGTIYSGTIL